MLLAAFHPILSKAESGSETRACQAIEHALGSSCVSQNPLRVAVLDTGELDMVLALGINPIASTTPYQVGQFPQYLPTEHIQIQSLGVVQEPDLEQLMRLKPDLILGSQFRHGRLYTLLSSIAPTVFSESVGASWADNLRLFARALDKDTEAENLLNEIDRQCQTIRHLYDSKGQPSLSIVRSMQTHIRLYLPGSFIGELMNRCGLLRPTAQSGKGFARRLRSPQQIDLLEGDIILLSEYSPKQGSLVQRWRHSGFWQRLRGQVYEIDDSYWMLGIGPLAAKQVLDDLEQIINDY
ncbi:hypothetical protein BGP75_12615 [Motiliproteus sp. MSK22-1]|nr:hypothetical protein BGP75_12615 [Motiliproteus sp. MSK22-1]